MRVLLVNPPAGSVYHRIGLRFVPLGQAYVGAALERAGHRVDAIDFEVETGDYRKVPYGQYDIVGVGSDTTRWPAAMKVAEAAKAAGAIVVAGGPHVSFMDKEALSTRLIDYVVRSEGEQTMVELTDRLAGGATPGSGLREVAGISYRDNGDIIQTPARPFIEDLDELPLPARHLYKRDRYRATFRGRELSNILSSRGCPFNCDFCSCSVFAGKRWRTRSVESILDEIGFLVKKEGYGALAFFDDNFTLDPARAAAISEGIIRNGWDIKWWAFSRTDTAVKHPELVKLMARAGLAQAFIGFESANQETLDGAGKKATIEASLETMRVFRENKVDVWGAFMLGFDDETEEMAKKTIRFAKLLNPSVAQFSLVTPYPGTRLFDRVRSRLLTTDWRRFWGGAPTIRLNHLRPERLSSLFRRAYLEFYMRPRQAWQWAPHIIKNTLRYYTQRRNVLKKFMAGKAE